MIDPKLEIHKRFERAASTYDGYADVQQETGLVLSRLLADAPPTTILELGCGTGGFTHMLEELCPEASLVCLDFSKAMIGEAQAKVSSARTHFQCIDCEEYLAKNKRQFDCVCSNATFQWFQEPRLVLRNIHRCLTPGGQFVASVFGPDCLAELGAGLRAVMGDEYTLPSPHFLGKKQLQTLCHDFRQVAITEEVFTRSYETIYDLLRVIKYTGTGGYHARVPRFNKKNLQDLSDWFMDAGGFTVQYQIFFIKAVKDR